jgi:hypothetical protein
LTLIFCRYSMWYISLLLVAGSISKNKTEKRLPDPASDVPFIYNFVPHSFNIFSQQFLLHLLVYIRDYRSVRTLLPMILNVRMWARFFWLRTWSLGGLL